jgi:hypothetical protein
MWSTNIFIQTSYDFSVTLGCGASINENVSYFEQLATISSGPCAASICKINANICQVFLLLLFGVNYCRMSNKIIINYIAW